MAGNLGGDDTQALLRAVQKKFLPNATLLHAGPAAAAIAPWLSEMKPIDGSAAAYVCENFACRAPITNPVELADALGRRAP